MPRKNIKEFIKGEGINDYKLINKLIEYLSNLPEEEENILQMIINSISRKIIDEKRSLLFVMCSI